MSCPSLVVHSFTNVKNRCVGSAIRMVVGRSRNFFVRDSLAGLLFVFRSLVVRCSFIVRIGSFGSLAHSLFVHRSLFVVREWSSEWLRLVVRGPCVKSTHKPANKPPSHTAKDNKYLTTF